MTGQSASQKTVLIGVTGCIAAYKACELVRMFQKRDMRVKVVMTQNATHFIDPTTFRALTHEPVAVGLFDDPSDPIHHISLAKEADVFVIAPCTANVAAKIAHGLADDLLTTTALASTCPLVIAPAMNVNMYENVATQDNLATLRQHGAIIVEAGEGYLACGDEGRGRLAELETIVDAALSALEPRQDLAGMRVLITTGPTREYIDPVRFISNPSSGKTGIALAQAAKERGADVTVIAGPSVYDATDGLEVVDVVSAQEMFDAVDSRFDDCDIAIFAAAVSDLRPKTAYDRKLKRGEDNDALGTIELVENPDILKTMGERKTHQIVIGYAAETNDVIENATKKLKAKNADMIVANDVSGDLGFGSEENRVFLITENGCEELPTLSKREIANRILSRALSLPMERTAQ